MSQCPPEGKARLALRKSRPVGRGLGLWLASLGSLLLLVPAAGAMSLKQALELAGRQNPSLLAQQHTVPAATAALARAQSGYLPRINATSQAGFSQSSSGGGGYASQTSRLRPRSVGLELSQTLFDGWRTQSTVRQAASQLGATEATLRDVTQSILVEAATVYLDVLQSAAVLRFEKENHANLSEQLKLVSGLFSYGDVTETDVLQVRARVSEAEGRVMAAEATWQNAQANFRRVIGVEPRNLSWPRPQDASLPGSVDQAVALALARHPAIEASSQTANAAWASIDIARSGYLPTVSVSASIDRQGDSQYRGDRQTTSTILGRITVPLFEGGETRARVAEAREVAYQRRYETDAVRDKIRSDIISAMNLHRAARARLSAVGVQVQAAAAALKGVKEEFGLGQRTAAGVLDAAQDLLRANIELIGAHRDRVLSVFLVKRALGQMSLDDMMATAHDPTLEPLGLFRRLTLPRSNTHPWAWELRDGPALPARGLMMDPLPDMTLRAVRPPTLPLPVATMPEQRMILRTELVLPADRAIRTDLRADLRTGTGAELLPGLRR